MNNQLCPFDFPFINNWTREDSLDKTKKLMDEIAESTRWQKLLGLIFYTL